MGAFHQSMSEQLRPQTGQQQPPPSAPVTFANSPASQPAGKAGGPGQAQDSPAATMGKGSGSSMTSSATSGQPQMGVPNQYSNTVQPMDNRRMGIAGMQAQGKGQ